MKEARCPKCGDVLETVELPDELTILACPSCQGAFYGADEITLPLKLEDPKTSSLACPSCGRAFETGTALDGKLPLARCPGCGGLWLEQGEIQKIRALTGVEGVVGRAHLAKALSAPAPERPAAPPTPKHEAFQPEPLEGNEQRNPDASLAPRVVVDGVSYKHFQTSWPVVTDVLGEFNWKVRVGDRATTRDFIAPPLIVSEDKAPGDVTWSQGEYVEPAEVWEAFNLPGKPPPRVGVAPCQPNPYSDLLQGIWKPLVIAATACVCSFLWSLGTQRTVLDRRFDFDAAAPEKSFVTEIFELPGRASSVRIDVNTVYNQHWADFDFALINADTDEAWDAGAETQFYSGVEDGEAWTEGSGSATLFVPSVPAGRYYLRVEPSSDMPSFTYNLRLVWGAPRPLYLALALLALLGPLVFLFFSWNNFETKRWAESDHPRGSSDDDD